MYIYIYICIYIYVCIISIISYTNNIWLLRPGLPLVEDVAEPSAGTVIHPVSITRFPLRRFSPGAGLLSNPFVHR